MTSGYSQIRGWRKQQLIRELAAGNRTQKDLAEEYEVSQPTISNFAGRNNAAIQAVKADLQNKFAGLWIAAKENRLAELEDIATQHVSDNPDPKAARIRLQALRQAAEELGDLHVNVNTTARVNYSVEGVDPNELT